MKPLEVLSYSMHEEVTHYVHPLSPEGHGSRQIFNHHLCEGKLHKQELLGLYVYHADTQFFAKIVQVYVGTSVKTHKSSIKNTSILPP